MKTAACIFSFDRPNYLERTIQSLTKNTIFPLADWFIFQDNPVVPDTGRTIGNIDGCRESLHKHILRFQHPKATIVTYNFNQGIPRTKLAAHKLTQDKYDWVFFFEDDMIVSPYYMELVLNMAKTFGPAFTYSACDLNMKAIESGLPKDWNETSNDHLNLVKKNMDSHFWGYLMNTSVIRCITPRLEEYCEFIGPDYKRRNHEEIMKKFDMGISSHDRLIEITAKKCGIKKINTVIPRARYIGEYRIHAKPEFYRESGFNKNWEYTFESDRRRQDFSLVD